MKSRFFMCFTAITLFAVLAMPLRLAAQDNSDPHSKHHPYRLKLSPAEKALTCSPAPCVLPNVRASEGGQPVNSAPIAFNPRNSKQLLTGGNDYNCDFFTGFYASKDGGSTWNHTCLGTGDGGGNPAVGYDRNNVAYAGFGGTYMGDYTGNVWVGHTLYASWMDSRNGTNMQVEVGGLVQ